MLNLITVLKLKIIPGKLGDLLCTNMGNSIRKVTHWGLTNNLWHYQETQDFMSSCSQVLTDLQSQGPETVGVCPGTNHAVCFATACAGKIMPRAARMISQPALAHQLRALDAASKEKKCQ